MATRRGRLRAALPLSTARPWRATPKIRAKHVCQCDLTALALQGVQLWSVAYGTDSFLGAALRSRESLLSCFARIDSQCGARWPLEALGSLWFYVLNILLLYLLANQLLQVPVFGYLASLRPSVPAECPPNGPLSGGTGRPPKAKAKEAAAKAEAKAAVASVPGLSLCSSLDRGSLGAAHQQNGAGVLWAWFSKRQ